MKLDQILALKTGTKLAVNASDKPESGYYQDVKGRGPSTIIVLSAKKDGSGARFTTTLSRLSIPAKPALAAAAKMPKKNITRVSPSRGY
jgi:hypothetical protein